MITFYKSKNSLIKSRISHGGSNRQRAELSVSLARTSVVQPHLCKEIMKFSLLPPSLKDWSDPHLPLLIFSSSTPTATNEK